jgi:hypothetical protein
MIRGAAELHLPEEHYQQKAENEGQAQDLKLRRSRDVHSAETSEFDLDHEKVPFRLRNVDVVKQDGER